MATFDEVMDFHPQNHDVFREIERSLPQLLPFVGSGLTCSVYGVQSQLMRKLGSYITNRDDRSELERMLNSGEYDEAAQFLEDKRGAGGLAHDLANYFSAEKLESSWDKVKRDAIWLLPSLFKRPLLTTNFDETLERVYEDQGVHLRVLSPSDGDLVAHARRLMSVPCVFKLHGTVVDDMITYDRIVFTKRQFERHYAPGNPVREALGEFARNRSLLILGSSLASNETVEVIREETGFGATHYAVLSCGYDKRDDVIRELNRIGIRAILYENGWHDSVRVLLEKWLSDTDFDAYQKVVGKVPSSATIPTVTKSTSKSIKVLMLASGPEDQDRLRLDKEAREIRNAIQLSRQRDAVTLEDRWAVRTKDLLQALNEVEPTIVHFSGHGGYDGSIALENESGQTQLVSPEGIAMALATVPEVKLAVFNACFSEAQAAEVVRHIDAAIGMSTSIGDEAAVSFASALYSAMGFGKSLQVAFNQALAAVAMSCPDERDTPQLYVAPGIDAANVYYV